MTDITVWSLPDCQGCRMTTRLLDKLGATFTVRDLSADPARAADFRSRGLLAAPIVEAETGAGPVCWSGFRPEVVRQVAAGLT